jgi:hypothetical protein
MSQVIHIVKIVGAWACLIGAVALLILTKDAGLATVLGIVSIAFSQAPE